MDVTFLAEKLSQRKLDGTLRSLKLFQGNQIDFSSNDYLGIAKKNLIKTKEENVQTGSTGSRLLTGNTNYAEKLEQMIAEFHNTEAAILFNSGYDANLGLLASVPQKGDYIFYDFLCHTSIRDGIRLSKAQSFPFRHNNLEDLENRLQKKRGDNNFFVVIESVYSMDGDGPPLLQILNLCEKYNALLIVDEAHATGLIGNKGEGLVQHLGFSDRIFARVHTFSKGCGCHGAVVVGSRELIDYLINFAHSFIYTTALPPHTISTIYESYLIFPKMIAERTHISKLISHFKSTSLPYHRIDSNTSIQIVSVPNNLKIRALCKIINEEAIDVRPILHPTVPSGSERIRVILHAFNTIEEIDKLTNILIKSKA